MQVSNKTELKRAIASNPDSIEIVDADLAQKIRILKKASGPALAALIAAGGVTAAMWWNPVGWTVGAVALTAESALVGAVAFFVAALGVSLLWALFNDWDIDASAEGSAEKGTAKVFLKLRPKRKS